MGRLYKHNRILDIYIRLSEGKVINKSEEAQRFCVNERSVQRDIDEIRAHLDERTVKGVDRRSIIYDRTKKGI